MSAIDISYWQHHPDFAQVHGSGVTLTILKCGGGEGGSLYTDSVYVANRNAARAVGLSVGSYFFNGPVDPVAAADYQFNVIDWRASDVVAIDVENSGNQQHWNPGQVLAWCQRMVAHGVPANRLLVYMSSSLLGAGWGAVALAGTRLWVAQYGPNDGNAHSIPGSGPWPEWSMWQYTSVATCPGIVGNVDTNQVSSTWASISETLITPDAPKLGALDMPKVISVAGGTIAFVTELSGRYYTSAADFSLAANRAVYGEVTGLTPDQVTTLVNEANARGAAFAAAKAIPAPAPVTVPAPATVDLSGITAALAEVTALVKSFPAPPRTFVAQ